MRWPRSGTKCAINGNFALLFGASPVRPAFSMNLSCQMAASEMSETLSL
jgi:hypothetical protein